MPAKPLSLELFAEVTTADGVRFKWDANQAPGSRLTNATFSDKIGEGFSVGGGQLTRRVDQDYPDVGLVNTITAFGADGSVAYEGRQSAMPRDLSDRHSVGVTLTGWMAHAADRDFTEIYADREMSAWSDLPINEQSRLALAGRDFGSLSFTAGQGGLTAALPNQALGAEVWAGVWYAAPTGCEVARFGYRGKDTSLPAGWESPRLLSLPGDTGGVSETSNSLTLDDTLRIVNLGTPNRYVYLRVYSSSTSATPAAGASRVLSKVAVYGNHGLALRTGNDLSEPDGVIASDVIRDIARRFCPQLDTSGVRDTTYVIQHLAFRDAITPYDAFLAINAFHQWHLGVWENKRLDFRPYDLTDYDWEIRTDDPGTTFSSQGPSTENVFNGITVTFTDLLTGRVERLTPDDYDDLRDLSSTNPWNRHGINRWDKITLSRPTIADQALQIGRATLAERNRPRAPGTITVRGYIRDREGNYQPYWKVRSGDTIAITNHPNDAPRLIVETDKDVESQTVKIAVDSPFNTVEAAQDRVENALTAAGLT